MMLVRDMEPALSLERREESPGPPVEKRGWDGWTRAKFDVEENPLSYPQFRLGSGGWPGKRLRKCFPWDHVLAGRDACRVCRIASRIFLMLSASSRPSHVAKAWSNAATGMSG